MDALNSLQVSTSVNCRLCCYFTYREHYIALICVTIIRYSLASFTPLFSALGDMMALTFWYYAEMIFIFQKFLLLILTFICLFPLLEWHSFIILLCSPLFSCSFCLFFYLKLCLKENITVILLQSSRF